jgi:excisionase family DNA binding protein
MLIMNDDLSNGKNTSSLENLPTPQHLWTTREVAEFLHVSIKTIFNLRKRGLPFVQVGGAVRFVPQEIKDHLAESRRLSSHRSRQIIRQLRPPHD